MLDYPGKNACVVFTPGCNFRCPFCHNPESVLPERIQEEKELFIPSTAFFEFLGTRK
jgi:pyruvate formate lyase activating enzyme